MMTPSLCVEIKLHAVPVWTSKFYGAFAAARRVAHWLICTQVDTAHRDGQKDIR